MDIKELVQASPCKKRKVACIVRKDNVVVSYGFNHGYFEQCDCSLTEKNPHVLHAEQMALTGTDDEYKGATLETTYQPCESCAVLIVNKGIKTVITHELTACSKSIDYLKANKVKVILESEYE